MAFLIVKVSKGCDQCGPIEDIVDCYATEKVARSRMKEHVKMLRAEGCLEPTDRYEVRGIFVKEE